MKKENLILVLFFGLMVLISILLSGILEYFPTSPVDKMFGQSVVVVDEMPVVDAEYSSILSKATVNDMFGKKIADLYVVRTDNSYFYMELYVGIDLDGKVYARDKVVTTKDETSASYFPLVRAYLLKNYSGLYYENIQYIDGAAGATTITVSRSTIKTVVEQTVIYHVGEPVDYINLLFDNDYTLVSSNTESDILISNVTVEGQAYTVYQATGTGTYYDRQATNTGEITVLIAVNNAGVITHVSLPSDLYRHSGGNFYNASKAFLEGIINTNILDTMPDSTTGPTVNSNGSQYLINQLLVDIQGVA